LFVIRSATPCLIPSRLLLELFPAYSWRCARKVGNAAFYRQRCLPFRAARSMLGYVSHLSCGRKRALEGAFRPVSWKNRLEGRQRGVVVSPEEMWTGRTNPRSDKKRSDKKCSDKKKMAIPKFGKLWTGRTKRGRTYAIDPHALITIAAVRKAASVATRLQRGTLSILGASALLG